jgi:hypothetical protein
VDGDGREREHDVGNVEPVEPGERLDRRGDGGGKFRNSAGSDTRLRTQGELIEFDMERLVDGVGRAANPVHERTGGRGDGETVPGKVVHKVRHRRRGGTESLVELGK